MTTLTSGELLDCSLSGTPNVYQVDLGSPDVEAGCEAEGLAPESVGCRDRGSLRAHSLRFRSASRFTVERRRNARGRLRIAS